MALVEQPKKLVVKVRCLYVLVGEERVALCHVGNELLVKHRGLCIHVQFVKPHGDGSVNLPTVERLHDVGGLHLEYVEVDVGVLLFQFCEEAWQQIGGDGGQDADAEGAGQRLLLFGNDVLYLVGARDYLPCLFHHKLADGRGSDLLG